MERVRYLRKYDPEVWYISGLLAITAGEEDEAWEDWRKSLEFSDEFLADIAKRSMAVLDPEELIETVIPENPGQLYRVAFDLYPKPTEKAERKPFLARALQILDEPGKMKSWEDWQLKARILTASGEVGKASTAYITAIQMDPSQIDLRLEYAAFLKPIDPQKARAQLLGILSSDPNHVKATELLKYYDTHKK